MSIHLAPDMTTGIDNSTLTGIFSSLSTLDAAHTSQKARPSSPGETGTGTLSRLAETNTDAAKKARSIMMTLHFLFPHELLPALDLLDRHLVTEMEVSCTTVAHLKARGESNAPPHPLRSNDATVFLVQSASAVVATDGKASKPTGSRSRYRKAFDPSTTYYEVRLDVWNCSCPAFAFSSFTLLHAMVDDDGEDMTMAVTTATIPIHDDNDKIEIDNHGAGWQFGGTATRPDAPVPICKHILAVALSRAAPHLFGAGVIYRTVSADEMAGWGAGWGDHG